MKLATQFANCPTSLTNSQIEQFRNDGYLAFENVLAPHEVEEARATISTLVRKSVREEGFELKGGWVRSTSNRFHVQFEGKQPVSDLNAQTDEEIELRVRKLMCYCEASSFFREMSVNHPRIRGVVESLIGAAPILFQDMALVKPPFIGSEKPWHQDNAYFAVTPLDAVLGVWIALDEATVENGCMHVLKGEHKAGPRKHYHDRDCEIVPDRIDATRGVPVELAAGGAMFFAGMLPHQTPPNASPQRRRALQFHYRSAESRIVDRSEYNRVYAEADGTPASCEAARKS